MSTTVATKLQGQAIEQKAKNAVAEAAAAAALRLRMQPGLAFEAFGVIRDKLRKVVRRPDLALNEMQRRVCEIYEWCRDNKKPCRIIILKPRQKGASTITIWLMYWHLRNYVANACLIGDEFEKSVKNLVNMFDFFAEQDVFPWPTTYAAPSGVFSHGSQLITETANDPRAGASGTFQFVLQTEVAHWPKGGICDAAGVQLALENCVKDAPGTVIIRESTPNGAEGAFYDNWEGAVEFDDFKAGSEGNGFIRVFFPWFAFEDSSLPISAGDERVLAASLDPDEKDLMIEAQLTLAQIAWRRRTIKMQCGGDAERFAQEYPQDAESCFLRSGRHRFNMRMVKTLKARQDLMHPPETGVLFANKVGLHEQWGWRQTDDEDCWALRWEHAKIGCSYLVTCDTMTGEVVDKDPDNHAPLVIRSGYFDRLVGWRPPRIVCRLIGNYGLWKRERKYVCQWDIDILADRLFGLSKAYGSCTIVVESNNDRGAIALLRNKGASLYMRPVFDKRDETKTEHYGWQTTEHTRERAVEALAWRIREHQTEGNGIDIPCPITLMELEKFIIRESGRSEAMVGAHDDNVIALAIGLQCGDSATAYSEPVREWATPADILAMEQRAGAHQPHGHNQYR